MRTRLISAIPLLLAVGLAAHAADFYKWTDAQGTVHYSQTPPQDRVAKTVYVNDGAPTAPLPGLSTAPQTPEQKAKAQSDQAAVQKTNTQALAANCASAQQNIADLQSRRMVVGSGDAHALDPQQREQALADARTQAATYCPRKP